MSLIKGYLRSLATEAHGVTSPVFSPDAARVAYGARREKDAEVVMLDGEAGPAFPSIVAGPVFSPDNRHVAFAISVNDAKALVIDGDNIGQGPASDTDFITGLAFAPDNRPACIHRRHRAVVITRTALPRVRGGASTSMASPGRSTNVPYLGQLRFSSDGKHVTYVVSGLPEGSRKVAFLVVNAREGKRYDDIFGPPSFR